MRHFLLFFFFYSCLQAAPPHIVLLLTDDHSAADCSVYGSKEIHTPHLEKLAAAGMVFERAYANSPSCAPSRASLFTGLYPARHGAEANHARPKADLKRLPAYLKDLGYEVVSYGKTGHYNHTTEQGFDQAYGYKYHDHSGVQACVDYLKTRKSTKPLALIFGSHWPHVPLPETPLDSASLSIPAGQIDTPEYRTYRARYLHGVKKMDEDIGKVYTAACEHLGSARTFFLQTSDHGAQLPFGKWNLYESGTRVSFIVQWEGHIAAGRRSQAQVQWLDILPTLVEVGGGTVPPGLDGLSLLPVITGKAKTHRELIFTTHTGDGRMNIYPARAVTDGAWKYVRNLHPEYRFSTHIDRSKADQTAYWKSWEAAAMTNPTAAKILQKYRQRPAEELFDLTKDPDEQNNVISAPENHSTLTKLRAELDAWMKSTGDKQQTLEHPILLTDEFSILDDEKPRQFHWTEAADVTGEQAPHVAQRPFHLKITLTKGGTQGVLAAQGGLTHGWTLFLRHGQYVFRVNRQGKAHVLTAKAETGKLLEVKLAEDGTATLLLDQKELASGKTGLLESQPKDGFQTGKDLAAPVGDYAVPFAFDGTLGSVSLEIRTH